MTIDFTSFSGNTNDTLQGVANKVKAVPATVTTADNTQKLGGQTPAQAVTQGDALSEAHRTATNNPHNLTPALLDVVSSADFAAETETRIPAGVLPISTVGQSGYLPLGVSGSFEGGTANALRTPRPIILENDGTLVMLRSATNGSSLGVYYSYVRNAMDPAATLDVVHTNTRYRPSFIAAGETVQAVFQSGEGVIVGELQDATGVKTRCFLALTEGTLNGDQHLGCFLDSSWSTVLATAEVFRGNDRVYILENHFDAGANPAALKVYELTLADCVSGAVVTPTQLTGWNSTTLYNTQLTSDQIVMARTTWSTDVSLEPLLYCTSGLVDVELLVTANGRPYTHSKQAADGSIRTLVIHAPRFRASSYLWSFYSFSFTWNPTSKVAVPDGVLSGPPSTISVAGADNHPTATGKIYARTWFDVIGHEITHCAVVSHYTEDGKVFNISVPQFPFLQPRVSRGTIDGFTTVQDALNVEAHTRSGWIIKTAPPVFGSPIGDSIMSPILLPNQRMITRVNGTGPTGVTSEVLVLASYGPSELYTYPSINNGSYTGFAPNPYRKQFGELGYSNHDYSRTSLLVEVGASLGQVATYGTVFIENQRNAGFLSIDENLLTSGSVTLDNVLMTNAKNAIITAAGWTGITSSSIEVHIPQNTLIPPIAIVSAVDASTGNFYAALAKVSVDTRTGTITTLTVDTLLQAELRGTQSGMTQTQSPNLRNGASYLVEMSDAYGFILHCNLGYGGGGWFSYTGAKILLDKTGAILSTALMNESLVTNIIRLGGMPGKGVGMFACTDDEGDDQTKLLFKPIANSQADWNAWAYKPKSDWRVVISQNVAEGWIVYFTEVTPVLFNGRSYSLPVTSIDLRSITATPESSTFYLYAVLNPGTQTVSYDITAAWTDEDPNRIWIGTITTDATQITAIETDKPVLFCNKRLEVVTLGTTGQFHGRSIPCLPGHPVDIVYP